MSPVLNLVLALLMLYLIGLWLAFFPPSDRVLWRLKRVVATALILIVQPTCILDRRGVTTPPSTPTPKSCTVEEDAQGKYILCR